MYSNLTLKVAHVPSIVWEINIRNFMLVGCHLIYLIFSFVFVFHMHVLIIDTLLRCFELTMELKSHGK